MDIKYIFILIHIPLGKRYSTHLITPIHQFINIFIMKSLIFNRKITSRGSPQPLQIKTSQSYDEGEILFDILEQYVLEDGKKILEQLRQKYCKGQPVIRFFQQFERKRLQMQQRYKDQINLERTQKETTQQKLVQQNMHKQTIATYQQKINELTLQNAQLKKQIQNQQHQIQEIQQSSTIEQLNLKISEQEHIHEEQMKRVYCEMSFLEQKNHKLSAILNSYKSELQRMEYETSTIKEFNSRSNEEISALEKLCHQLEESLCQWQNRALMQKEDMIQLEKLYKTQNETLQVLQNKMNKIETKLNRLTIEKSKEVDIPEINFDEEQSRMQFLKKIYQKDKTFIWRLQEENESFKKIHINVQDTSELSRLKLQRPTFMTFYDTQLKIIESEMQRQRKLSLDFFGTLRAVQDAKYNDIIYNKELISRFPEFVMSWLQQFSFDVESRTIKNLDYSDISINQDDIKLKFLLNLMSPQLDKLWEVTTFKDFLFEKSSPDEIFFYLHARNLLFRGPQLNDSKSSFEAISYVSFQYADFLVSTLLQKYDPHNLSQVKKMLKDRIKKKTVKQEFIDGYYVLRVLLEVFRIERGNRYRMIKEVFSQMQSVTAAGKIGVNFKNFKRFIETNYPNTSSYRLHTIYRDCQLLGVVNADTFFVVASEQNFFAQNIQINSVDQPKELCQTLFNETQGVFDGFLKDIYPIIGIEKLIREPKDHYSYMDQLLRMRNVLLHQISLMKSIDGIVLPTLRLPYSIEEEHQISKDLSHLRDSLIPIFKEIQSKKNLLDMEKNIKVKKIQRLCRQKLSKFYSFMSSIISAKLKLNVRQSLIIK